MNNNQREKTVEYSKRKQINLKPCKERNQFSTMNPVFKIIFKFRTPNIFAKENKN